MGASSYIQSVVHEVQRGKKTATLKWPPEVGHISRNHSKGKLPVLERRHSFEFLLYSSLVVTVYVLIYCGIQILWPPVFFLSAEPYSFFQ